MNIRLLQKKRKTLIIADDGGGFWGVIADSSGISTDHRFPANTDLKKILEFGKEQKAYFVLYLQSADVRELEVKLGRDLSSDERRTAIEYAAASSENDRDGSLRISYMDGMFHDFRSGILASYFDTENLLSIADAVKSMKMKFLGITNFKQLLLAQHFSDPEHHGDAFLFMLGNQGVAAIPERNRLLVRNLPFGLPGPGNEEEWKERAQRRLNGIFRHKNVCFYTPEPAEHCCSILQEVSEADSVEPMDWAESLVCSTVFFLAGGHRLIHPALPPPGEKDPKAAGTFCGIFFLAATLLALGFLAGRNMVTGYILERDIASAQKLIDTVKQEKDALAGLEKELAGEVELFSVMQQKQRVSRNTLRVMNLLARYPLQYSRITAIEERANGIFLEGESVWQPDLSGFFTHFEGELSKYQLTLFSDGLSKEKDGRIRFRSHIAPAGGVR